MNKTYQELTDEELMREYRLGDFSALEELYRRHAAKVYGFLRKRIGDSSRVEDIFQDTFLRVHRYRARYDSTLPFVPWLFVLCRSAMVDNIRREKKETISPRDVVLLGQEALADNSTCLTDIVDPEAFLNVRAHIEKLSSRERAVLFLHYREGLSFREVASRLNLRAANARKLSSRAIEKLREILKRKT